MTDLGSLQWRLCDEVPPLSPGDYVIEANDGVLETRTTLVSPGLAETTEIDLTTGEVVATRRKEVPLDFGAVYFS